MIKLLSWTNTDPSKVASYAGRICYSSNISEEDIQKEPLDVEKTFFSKGHHTVLEHFFLTFLIDNISINDVTFGLHLNHPFYNSSQRSGRYSAKMFWKDNTLSKIEKEIKESWPSLSKNNLKITLDYIKMGLSLFRSEHKKATVLAEKILKEERPFISEKNLKRWAPKIAQEQLRMFISTILPTSLVYTINLISLATLWRVAWTPGMKKVIENMVREVKKHFPALDFLFLPENKSNFNWQPNLLLKKGKKGKILTEPRLKLLSSNKNFNEPTSQQKDVVDILQYAPWYMDDNIKIIKTSVEVSLATFAQDQRHRTLRRSEPEFTGNFYLPPLLQKMKLEKEAKDVLGYWLGLKNDIPENLWMSIAPYGAMVKYTKIGSLNSFRHEQNKRLCWRAQEEIYWLSCLERKALGNPEFLKPPCFPSGICPEGNQYCGRDRQAKNYFPRRKV